MTAGPRDLIGPTGTLYRSNQGIALLVILVSISYLFLSSDSWLWVAVCVSIASSPLYNQTYAKPYAHDIVYYVGLCFSYVMFTTAYVLTM